MPMLPLALLRTALAEAESLIVPQPVWVAFAVFLAVMLALDLGILNRRHHAVSFREASIWSGVWISLALLFGAGLYIWQAGLHGHERGLHIALKYLTGYILELSLSIDNLFVIALIFAYFKVEQKYQHFVLFCGIAGALVMRGGLIFLGLELIHRFHWLIYVFGAFLIFTGVKMALSHGETVEPEKNPVIRLFKRIMPVTHETHGARLFLRKKRKLYATPLFVALLMVEVTDLVFAVDSIPAVLAVTHLPFLVVTSNAFAVMGLRSLYFALAGFMGLFHLLHYGLAAVLVFIGTKMLLEKTRFHVPIGWSLAIVVTLIAGAVVASLLIKKKPDTAAHGAHADGTPGDVLPEEVS
jgi:tellurite resistance protein TerC